MPDNSKTSTRHLARLTGLSLLGAVIVGVLSALFVVSGIDVNLTADIAATAENMMEAEQRLRAKAYIALLVFALGAITNVGLFLLLRRFGQLLAGWSLFVGLAAAILSLMGAVYTMNAAHLAGSVAFQDDETLRLALAKLQATSDYTSFHLGLVLSSASMAGFFYLFLRSGQLPKFIAGWGLFASLFVVAAIVARDFISFMGHDVISGAFMLCNLLAIIMAGSYLAIRGVRASDSAN